MVNALQNCKRQTIWYTVVYANVHGSYFALSVCLIGCAFFHFVSLFYRACHTKFDSFFANFEKHHEVFPHSHSFSIFNNMSRFDLWTSKKEQMFFICVRHESSLAFVLFLLVYFERGDDDSHRCQWVSVYQNSNNNNRQQSSNTKKSKQKSMEL